MVCWLFGSCDDPGSQGLGLCALVGMGYYRAGPALWQPHRPHRTLTGTTTCAAHKCLIGYGISVISLIRLAGDSGECREAHLYSIHTRLGMESISLTMGGSSRAGAVPVRRAVRRAVRCLTKS